MKKHILILTFFISKFSIANEIATFDGSLAHIPNVRLDEEVAEDVYLRPVGSGRFNTFNRSIKSY